jgi:hypothetical protein
MGYFVGQFPHDSVLGERSVKKLKARLGPAEVTDKTVINSQIRLAPRPVS